MTQNTLVITLQFYRLIVVQAEKRKGFKSSKQGDTVIGKNQVMSSNSSKKRGTSPGSGAGGMESSRNLRATKIVKVTPGPASVRGKSPKSPKRAVAKLVRTASEDDGTAVYPAHSSAFLLHTENDTSWRQYSRVGHSNKCKTFVVSWRLFLNREGEDLYRLAISVSRPKCRLKSIPVPTDRRVSVPI